MMNHVVQDGRTQDRLKHINKLVVRASVQQEAFDVRVCVEQEVLDSCSMKVHKITDPFFSVFCQIVDTIPVLPVQATSKIK